MRLEKLRYFFTLHVKNVQIRLSTWRQGREIAKAYGQKTPVSLPSVPRVPPRLALLCLGCLLLFAAVYFAAPYGAKGFKAVSAIAPKAALFASNKKTEILAVIQKAFAANPKPRTPPAAGALAAKDSVAPAQPLTNSIADTARRITAAAPGIKSTAIPAMEFCIVANKANRTLTLLSASDTGNQWKSIETFSILVGLNEGQKMTEGDKRTPEGTYFIVGRKETEELNAIYGPLAYVLNYPNEEDRKAGRTGQGIWIHGTREDTTREATRGCVVLNNKDVVTLARYLQLGIGTPVLIVNMPGLARPDTLPSIGRLSQQRQRIVMEYGERQSQFKELVGQWKQAWESRNIDEYSRFYDAERFSGEGMRWEAWRDKKERIFKTFNRISVEVDKLCVSEFSDSLSVVLFLQRYESETLHLQRPKKLSFVKSDGQWKIYKEETFSRQELLL